jgi:hypothetical protein
MALLGCDSVVHSVVGLAGWRSLALAFMVFLLQNNMKEPLIFQFFSKNALALFCVSFRQGSLPFEQAVPASLTNNIALLIPGKRQTLKHQPFTAKPFNN